MSSVVKVRQVIRWPTSTRGGWWVVDNRGTDDAPLYDPVSGPYPNRRNAEKAMEDLSA